MFVHRRRLTAAAPDGGEPFIESQSTRGTTVLARAPVRHG
jgi:hypothetical protein